MARFSLLASVCGTLLLFTVAGISSEAEKTDEGFTPLFNGKDLTGWDGDPRFWSVKDGVIRGETTKETPATRNTFLIWRGGTLSDFELRLSFRISSGNSGVQIRSKDRGDWRVTGYQVEVVPGRAQMGLLYEEGGRGRLAEPGQKVAINEKGEKTVLGSVGDVKTIQSAYSEKDWNDLVVIARGSHITQTINGVLFSELTDEDKGNGALSGVLALQLHAGPPMLVEYKDIRIKALANEIALFNGTDLTGWKIVDTEDFESHGKVSVQDGTIRLEQGDPFTGIAWTGEFPKNNYEANLEAMRVDGYDFFCGMTFPIGDSWATLIVGGWGGMVVGISNVDDMNASENQTTRGISFELKQWYPIRLRVTTPKIEVWIDSKKVIDLAREGHRFNVWPEQQPIRPFGVATWMTTGALRNITMRKLDKEL